MSAGSTGLYSSSRLRLHGTRMSWNAAFSRRVTTGCTKSLSSLTAHCCISRTFPIQRQQRRKPQACARGYIKQKKEKNKSLCNSCIQTHLLDVKDSHNVFFTGHFEMLLTHQPVVLHPTTSSTECFHQLQSPDSQTHLRISVPMTQIH